VGKSVNEIVHCYVRPVHTREQFDIGLLKFMERRNCPYVNMMFSIKVFLSMTWLLSSLLLNKCLGEEAII
jgi:hypothetical protein